MILYIILSILFNMYIRFVKLKQWYNQPVFKYYNKQIFFSE